MSDEKQQENFSSLDQAIDTLSDLLNTREDNPLNRPVTPDYDEAAVPVLSDIVVPEEELQQELDPPVLQREDHLAFTLLNEEENTPQPVESAPEELPEPPMATEELLRELEDIVDQELEKVTRSARESILDSLKNRLDARQDANSDETASDTEETEPLTPALPEHPVYLPMSNWKKDEDEDISSPPLFTGKQDD
jgi:type VI protein secretion system component VasK